MKKRVLDVGNCVPDHAAIRNMLVSRFAAEVLQTDGPDDTLALLRVESVDLVLINRKLDQDYSDGIEILRQIKSDPQLASLPVMLVTNYQDHQEAAVREGAAYGFGKLALHEAETHGRLAEFLGEPVA
ncbi:MAG: response regulator [Planctomycetales bacterium]|nr:response regulator [Planctomycetales bacterium]